MKDSWLSYVLPNDEYKAQKVVYFLGEGSLLMCVSCGILVVGTHSLPEWNLPAQWIAVVPILLFVAYVFIRYIFSGIEYANVMSEDAFKKEKKRIMVRSASFMIIFSVLYLVSVGLQLLGEQLFDFMIVVFAGLFMFLAEYTSLKRSYLKNKELLD